MSTLLAPRRWATLATRLTVAVLIGFVAVCVLWRVQGGEWARVESPSMGSRAPVGSLLWVQPVESDAVQAGDFVMFRPPGAAGTSASPTYSHLVLERHADGTLTTGGTLSGPDPWSVTGADVVGEVAATWRGVGWLVAAAPLLLGGGLAVAAVRRVVRREWRLPAAMVLGSLVLAAAVSVHRPLLDAQQLGAAPDATGGAQATYVGTGLLPVRLESADGASVVLGSGEVGTVRVDRAERDDAAGRVSVELAPALPWWWWLPLVLTCLLPALVSSARGLTPRRGSPGRAWAAGCHRRPRAAFR